MRCSSCGLVNFAGAESCRRCGTPASARFQGTGSQVQPPTGYPQSHSQGNAPLPPVKARTKTSFLQFLRIAGALAGVAVYLYIRFHGYLPSTPAKDAPTYTPIKYLKFSAENPYSEATLRENVMTYVMHPRLLYAEFGGKTMAQKLFKDAWVEEYDHESKQVYFGLEKSRVSREMLPVYISDFIVNTSRVEFATESGSEVRLKDYTADSVKFYTAYLFRTPLDNVKVDIDGMLDFGNYQLSMREMADFMSDKVVYGGNPEVQSPNSKIGASILMGNHGVFVARPNEPSLQRFVRNYFSRFPGSQNAPREQRIQLLLDFVSEEIDFDTREANSSKEWLKRPNETLISMRGDCSNKSILFASLLEQIDEDYLLVYVPGHITVAVRKGDFPVLNGLAFDWQGESWVIAETTAQGFRVGESVVEGAERLQKIEYVQRPSRQITIYNYTTNQPLAAPVRN